MACVKGGLLAWKLSRRVQVVVDVVEHMGIGSGLEVYQKEVTEGEHNK